MDEARAGDIVLLAGKGHEDYQIFADRTIHFDDREMARKAARSDLGYTEGRRKQRALGLARSALVACCGTRACGRKLLTRRKGGALNR